MDMIIVIAVYFVHIGVLDIGQICVVLLLCSNCLAIGLQKWRKLYLKRHIELGVRARSVEKFVEACSRSESLEVRDYLNAVETLIATRFGFEDVQRFLFNPKMNVLLNLVGVHYCLTRLGIRVFLSSSTLL